MLLMSEVSKVVFAAVYRVMLLMLEVSKVNSFVYYVLCKKFKMVLHIFANNFLNIQWIFNPKKVLYS